VKTEHVQAAVRFVRRLQLSDLMLPAGAALVSAGLQKLVDRETVQRRRLVALNELVDDHRQTLEANGVELPVDRFGDEVHPLDIEGALELILLRAPSEAEPAPAPARSSSRRGVRWTIASLLAGGLVLAFPGGRKVLRDGAGALLDGLRPYPWGPDDTAVVPPYGSGPDEPPLEVAEPETLERDEPPTDPALVEAEPLESCGWTGCQWTSQPDKSQMSQQTAAAVHRNKCFYRPPTAVVPE
jgi:hypothetical protein